VVCTRVLDGETAVGVGSGGISVSEFLAGVQPSFGSARVECFAVVSLYRCADADGVADVAGSVEGRDDVGKYATELAFESQGDRVASAQAEGGDAFVSVAALHFVEQCHEDAGAAGSDRMADGDRTAVDIDAVE